MTVKAAVDRLQEMGITSAYTKRSVHSKVRALARRAFNAPNNLRIGLQDANSALGRIVDREMLERHGQRIQRVIDDHVRKFILDHAVPGVPFRVTQSHSYVVEWEVTYET
jgi:hypothetical protein